MTHTHTIDTRTARALAARIGARLHRSRPVHLVALSDTREALQMHRTSEGFELRSETLPVDQWADRFGLSPYKPGRVALGTSPRGEWAQSLERIAQA